MADIFLDYVYTGNVENPKEFVKQLIEERRKGGLNHNININYNEKTDEVFINRSGGRARRPLIVVKDGKALLTDNHIKQLEKNEISWDDLINQGVIEYLDALEEENAYISFFKENLNNEHTHLEIAPIAMLGLVTSLVPFGNYSHGVRLLQGAKNQKQAIGFYAANYALRMDMDVNILLNPQKPIVKTVMHDLSDFNKHPSGQNMVVAILSYKGYNMDDAIVLNRGSVDRGLARSVYFRPELSEELRYAGGLTDEICVPDKDVRGYRSEKDYRFLEEEGIVYPEAKVAEGDVVIGKTSPPRFLSAEDEYSLASNTRRESSISIKHGEQGTVDFVAITENEEGNKLIHVRLRDQRTPEIGDKFTSRYGQKGVLGLIIPNTDMPFTASGITPDLLFTPHGIPSRMTLNHLIEIIGGKVGSLNGRDIDGTTFQAEKEEDIRKELHSLGFKENGTETMYNGQTGEQFDAKIYIGSMYYLKLKHMVANKIHSRARGPIQLLTRQPTEGRAKEGGLRLGEMEKDTFIAHGASLLLKERFDSDKTIIPVCEECGALAIKNEYKNQSYCQVCGDGVDISEIEVSYAFKLFLDEIKALGINPKLSLKNKY